MVCVLHARSLTRIHARARARALPVLDRHYYKTYASANPFVPRFHRRRRPLPPPRRLSRSRRAASLAPLALRGSLLSFEENFAFSSFFQPVPPVYPFRDLPPEVFGFLNANGTTTRDVPRPNSHHVTPARVIDRSFAGERDRVLRACHFTGPYSPLPFPTLAAPSSRRFRRRPASEIKRRSIAGLIAPRRPYAERKETLC